jgi:hypothetical protein
MYKVYCLRDKDKNIIYVGQTRQELSKRLTNHKVRYNLYDITIELVSEVPTIESALILESLLINQYDLVNKGLNKSSGYDNTQAKNDSWREDFKDKSNGFYGHEQTEHAKKSLSERSKGNSYAKGNPSRKGRKNSDSWVARMQEVKNKPVMCMETGKVYESGKAAAEDLGLQRSKICLVCKGKRKSTGGLTFIYV